MLNPRKELSIVANVLADKVSVSIQEGDCWSCDTEKMIIYYPRHSWLDISDFGLIVHEAAHLRFSNVSKQLFGEAISKLGKEKEPLFGLHNVFEDCRVNKRIKELYKGAYIYLDEFYYQGYVESFDQYNNSATRKWYYWGQSEYEKFLMKNRWTSFCIYWVYYFEVSEEHADSLLTFFKPDVIDAIQKSKEFISTNFPNVYSEEDVVNFLKDILKYYLPLVDDEEKEDKKEDKKGKGKDKKDEEDGGGMSLSDLEKMLSDLADKIKDELKKSDADTGSKKKSKDGSDDKSKIEKINKSNPLGIEVKEVKTTLGSRELDEDALDGIFAINREKCYLTPDELATEVSSHLAQVKKSVSALKDSETNRYEGGYDSGKIENRKLWKLMSTRKTKIFSRKIVQSNDNKDMAVAILVDVSGSMRDDRKCHHACVSATLLAKALEMSGKPVAVYSFNEFYKTHKRWNKKIDYKEMVNLENIVHEGTGTGDNNDGYAVWKTAKELSKRTEKNKIMIVLSDGCPVNSHYDSPEGRPYHSYDLRTEAKNAEKIAKVYSVGIIDDNVKRYYQRYVIVNDTKELAPVMLKFFKENAGKRRK